MPVQDDPISMRFGNYEVLSRPDGKPDELGRGGFGRTYRARHSFLGTEMALKVIIDRLAFDEAAKKRFLKEAREHARLNHPGIARIADFGEAEGTFFYAMELCPDGDLKEFVRKSGAVPPVEAMQLIRQTAEALQYAHRRNILHRDIKPSNLLLVMGEGLPQVKLIDFGLVKRIVKASADETMDHESASQWSPAFASPEQIREQALDERTDIFSLGMTAWFLIAGGGPVEGSTMGIVEDRLKADSYEPRLPATLTGPLRAVVARMVEKDTARRYRNCTEFLEDLLPALDNTAQGPVIPEVLEPRMPSLSDRFTLEPAGRVYLGEVFRGFDRMLQTKVRLTLVYKEHEPSVITETAGRVQTLASAPPPGLMPVLEMTEFQEGWAVVEEEPQGPAMAEALRRQGTVDFQKIAPLLWDAASGLDAAQDQGAAPAPLEQAVVEGIPPAGAVDWAQARIHIPVQLLPPPESGGDDGDGNTGDLTMESRQASPLKSLASLIYRAVGGRAPAPGAFFSVAACIAIPGLSDTGNRTLAATLAGSGRVTDCRGLVRALLTDEGLPAEGVFRRAQERRQKALDAALERETARIDRATASIEGVKAGYPGAADPTSTATASRAATRAAELTATVLHSPARTEPACHEALRELRLLAAQAENAAATVTAQAPPARYPVSPQGTSTTGYATTAAATGRMSHSTAGSVPVPSEVTGTRQSHVTGPASPSATQTADALRAIDAIARQARESSDAVLRLKMPPGLDDTPLSLQQVEARRAAKEAAAARQHAQDLQASGTLDNATASVLYENATNAAAVVTQALETARRLTSAPDLTSHQTLITPPRLDLEPEPEPETVYQLQPAVENIQTAAHQVQQRPYVTEPVAQTKKGSPALVFVLVFLFLAGGGAGGWYFYTEAQKKKDSVQVTVVKDPVDPPPVKPRRETLPGNEKGNNGTPDDNHEDSMVDPKENGNDTKQPEPPVVPKPRQVLVTFTGDLPKEDSEITFPGVEATPKTVRSGGKLNFLFSLLPEIPAPKPVLASSKLSFTLLSEAPDKVEYQLKLALPPAKLRVKGFAATGPEVSAASHPVNVRAATIAQQYGRTEGDDLVFENGAEEDGTFQFDIPCWEPEKKPVKTKSGEWEVRVKLRLVPIPLDPVPGPESPWKSVTFTPGNLEVLPGLKEIEGLGRNSRPIETNLRFGLVDVETEPLLLPPGEYTVVWTPADPNGRPSEPVTYKVPAQDPPPLRVPAMKED